MVSGGMTCVKYLLFVFNLVFFLAGLGLVALGAVFQIKFKEFSALYGAEVNLPAVFLILTGAVVFIISFFGCTGAYKENYCMVYTYATLLGFILLLEVVAVIAVYTLKIQINLEQPLKQTMANYGDPNHEIVTKAWDKSQAELQCCGVHGYRDWWSNNANLNRTGFVPDSCCIKEVKDCGKGIVYIQNETTVYNKGCYDKIWDAQHNLIVIGAVAGLGVLQLLCVVFACCLARSIHREYETVAGMSKC